MVYNKSNFLFISFCLYLLSQAYTIPILPIGPSWAVWPTLSDLTLLLLLISLYFNFKIYINYINLLITKYLLFSLFLLIFSYIFSLIKNYWYSTETIYGKNNANYWGIFILYNFVKFIFTFYISSTIYISKNRITVILYIVLLVFIIICSSIIIAFFSPIFRLYVMLPYMPESIDIAGPWFPFKNGFITGGGFVGYNHAYSSLQVFCLSVFLSILISNNEINIINKNLLSILILSISLFSIFLTGSRAGLISYLFYICCLIYNQKNNIIFIILFIFIFLIFEFFYINYIIDNENIKDAMERQSTIINPLSSDNLSGRDQIWVNNLNYFKNSIPLWLFGNGFGSILTIGYYSHNLYLTILIETGIIGLLYFIFYIFNLLKIIYYYELKPKYFFIFTLSLLISCFSQETFLPVPALGNFLGLYLCILAIELNINKKVR